MCHGEREFRMEERHLRLSNTLRGNCREPGDPEDVKGHEVGGDTCLCLTQTGTVVMKNVTAQVDTRQQTQLAVGGELLPKGLPLSE